MRFSRICKATAVTLAMMNVVVPASQLFATEKTPAHPARRLSDVSLGENGRMAGTVVNGNGQVLPHVVVSVKQNGRAVGQTTSNDQGRFQIDGVRGGLCEVETNETVSVFCCWGAKAAPPSAATEVLVVSDTRVARGQRPIGEVLTNPLLIGLIITAAVAIPIAIHNSAS